MSNSKKKAAVYMRYSSHNQTENSIEGQKAVIYAYAARNEYEITDEYIDRAKSGTNMKRNALDRLLTECEQSNRFSYVLVYKLDRFARDVDIHTTLEKHLKNNGKRLISVTEHVNEDDMGSKINKEILKILNETESIKISENTLRGLKVNATKAESTGGICPLGYDMKDKKLVVNEFEAQAVRLIFDLYSNGFNKNFICNELNRSGYRTKIGNQFGINSLSSILSNAKYVGLYTYNRRASKKQNKKRNNHEQKPASEIISVEGGCPSIISQDQFDRVQTILTQKSKALQSIHKQTYLLSGLVKCQECGSNMLINKYTGGRDSRHYISFYCKNHKKAKTCATKDVDKNALEAFVAHTLSEKLFAEESVANISKAMGKLSRSLNREDKRKLLAIGQELGGIENGIKNYIKRLSKTTSDVTISYIEAEIEELESQKKTLMELQAAIGSTTNTALSTKQIMSLKKYFSGYLLSPEHIIESRLMLNTLISEIMVSNDEIVVIFNTP